MKKLVTEQSFYKYLKCPAWIWREAEAGEDIREPLLQKLQDEGLLEEKERELLKNRPFVEVNLDDMDEASVKTIEYMKQGKETIYKGTLMHGHWVGRPDLLERVEGESNLGGWYYVAVDIKRSHHLKDEYKFQGAFYAELLARIQGVKPVQGYVMHVNGAVDSYAHDEFESEYDLTLESIERILNGEREPHFLTSQCKQSPWFFECHRDTQACDNLSVLNRIWRSEAHALENAGIDTLSKLADAPVDALKKVPGLTMDRLYLLQQQAIAIADHKVVRLGDVDLPAEDGVALVIDIESDPLRDVDYLFGVLVASKESQTYHPFVAKDPKEEESNWLAFVNFLKEYAGATIYHYGWYEIDVFRRLSERYGAPDEVKRMFEEQMIDVLTRMREKVIFPTPFYSLKDIAKHLGFKWRSDDASGVNSVLWYQDWMQTKDESILKKIVEYNEDDVLATWFVRNWAVHKDDV